MTFARIEAAGAQEWLAGLREELVSKTYRPQPVRRVTRGGTPCCSSAVAVAKHCRMHGGKGFGMPMALDGRAISFGGFRQMHLRKICGDYGIYLSA